MPTYRVYPHDYPYALGANELKLAYAGDSIPVTSSGNTYIIDPSMNSGFGIENTVSSSPIDATIQFDASNTGLTYSQVFSVSPDINPNFVIGDNVDISNFNISAPWSNPNMDNFNLTMGVNSTVGYVHVGGSGTSGDLLEINFNLGDGASLGAGLGDAIAAGGSYLDFHLVAGAGVTLDGDLALGGGFGQYDVSFGANSTVTGNFSWGGSYNTYTANFGDGFTLNEYFAMGGSGNTQTITFGDDATLGGDFLVGGANNVNTIAFGDNATIMGNVWGSTSGSETWTFGRDWRIDGLVDLQSGDDVLVLGATTRDTSGTINGGLGYDTLNIAVRSMDQVAWDAAIAAAGWTDNGDGTYTSNGWPLVYDGVTYTHFETAATFVCFAEGTLIRTPTGDVPIETLVPGDSVETLDHGAQQLEWVGHRTLSFPDAPESQRPVEIRAGGLGQGLPYRDLVVSPQHRILMKGAHVRPACGVNQVLGPAKGLLSLPKIRQMKGARRVTYYSLLFKEHEVIWAEGVLAESLLPGPEALKALGPVLGHQVMRRFPKLALSKEEAFPPARKLANFKQTAAIAQKWADKAMSIA